LPPLIATFFFLLGIAGLFFLDRDRKVRPSRALWIPVIWILLVGSRPVSEWMSNTTTVAASVERIAEGNPLERGCYTLLLVIGLAVLATRKRTIVPLLRANLPIVVFVSYCAVSVLWSDFPNIAFKRWIKSLGDVVAILVVLTDPAGLGAIKKLLTRTGFLLIPLSILLIKYYPNWGRAYNGENGSHSAVGVTNDKNMLGIVCLILGLGAVWRLIQLFQEKRRSRNYRAVIAQGTLFLMVAWLFKQAHSATSVSCFLMATALMVFTTFPLLGRRKGIVHMVVIGFITVACSALFLQLGSGLLNTMGRDSTLTGRTELWGKIVGMSPNNLLGAGFESFWLGARLQTLWDFFHWKPNEAHNGYLEVFLNLGWIGVALLANLILAGYRNAVSLLRTDPEQARIRLAYFLVGMTYSFTEAGFRMLSLSWIAFLLGVTMLPRMAKQSQRINAAENGRAALGNSFLGDGDKWATSTPL
jgi:exopolysaccharide production protein ExoQ